METTNPIKLFFETCVNYYGETRVKLETTNEESAFIYIHYPIINIKTKQNQTHIIKDLYVKIKIKFENNQITIFELYGIRGILSKLEYSKAYAHPYINSSLDDFASFCLSDFSLLKTNFTLQYNETEETLKPFIISSFLNSLTQYLSFDGGAGYKKTRDLIGLEELEFPSKTLTFLLSDFQVNISELIATNAFNYFKITYEKGIEVISVDKKKLETYLLNLINFYYKKEEDLSRFYEYKLLGKKIGKDYYSLDTKSYNLAEVTIVLDFLVLFNKPPLLVIEDVKPVNLLENAKTVINPVYLSTLEKNLLKGYKSIINSQLY